MSTAPTASIGDVWEWSSPNQDDEVVVILGEPVEGKYGLCYPIYSLTLRLLDTIQMTESNKLYWRKLA